MKTEIIILFVVLGVILASLIGIYFTARYFFRFTILRKPTATLDNNINANTKYFTLAFIYYKFYVCTKIKQK